MSLIEIIHPKDKEEWLGLRLKDVTSTEVSSLFGVSPYLTKFELWHRKKSQQAADFVESDRMKWGSRLEASIAKGIAEDRGWTIRHKSEYIRDAELKAGASFDYEIEETRAILEIKNVDFLMFKQGWLVDEDGGVEAAPHIELQVQQQMLLAGVDGAYIGVLVGGNDCKVFEREADKDIQDAIQEEIYNFWLSIERDLPPTPDFTKDAEFITSLYQSATPGTVVQANDRVDDLATVYLNVNAQIKELEARKAACKAEMLSLMGTASKMLGNGYTVSAGMVAEKPIQYVRRAYRDFRVTFKKS